MSKEKSSNSFGSSVGALRATSKTLVIQAKVLDVKKSNGNTTIVIDPIERSLGFSIVYNGECWNQCYREPNQYGCYDEYARSNVFSISSKNVDRLAKELNDDGRMYHHWQAMIQKGDETTKVCNVKNAKSTNYNGKKCLELVFYTKNIAAKGATATEAVDLADINQRDTLNITMVSNITIPIPEDQSKIIDYVEKTSSLSTLETALEAAGLDEALAGIAGFTLFAPNDDAFKKLPAGALSKLLEIRNKEKLEYLLQGHLVKGWYTASDLVKLAKKGGNIVAVNGDKIPLKLRGDKLRIGYDNAEVALADIGASNGTVHIIKQVLITDKFLHFTLKPKMV